MALASSSRTAFASSSRALLVACTPRVARTNVMRTFASASDKTSTIKQTVADNKVVVYSKTYCPYCTRVKGLLTELKVPIKVFELDNMSDGDAFQASLQGITGSRTVPQVFIGGQFIGGCDDTVALHNAGKLVPKLKAAGVSN